MPAEIAVHDLAARLERGEGLFLLDVRRPEEHAYAALPGTHLLVPLQELPRRRQEVTPPPGATVVAYCHHGVRSWLAAEFLEAAGLPHVLSLAGGIDAWSREVDPSVPRY